MPRFRRKPHEIDAAQWYPGTKVKGVCEKTHKHENPVGSAHVHTRYGRLVYVTAGQYVVPDGSFFYPCDSDVFENTYQPIGDGEAEVYEVEQPSPRIEQAPIGGMIFQPNDEGDEELRGRAMSLAEEADEIARRYVSGR